MSEKYKKTCKYFNYVEHLLFLALKITGCVSMFSFSSLVCINVGITSSAVGLKNSAITAGMKKYKSNIKKKNKNHDKIVLLGKAKLNTTEVLTSKSLIDSYISHSEFVSANNTLREYNEMKQEIKTFVQYTI